MKPKRFIDAGVVALSSKPKPATLPRACCRLTLTLLLWAICLVTIFVIPAYAGDGDLDPSFIIGPGPYAGVQTIPEIRGRAVYPWVSGAPYNNYTLLFGTFWGVNVGGPGPNNNCIARLTNTGALDTTFVNNEMLNGEIRAVYIYPHDDPNFPDKILIAGRFNAFTGNSNYCNFARLNANGSIDTTFPQVILYGGAVNSFAVQGSGTNAKILVGGYSFSTGMDEPGCHLLRLNYDGNLDGGYTPWTAPGGYINSIKIYPSSDLVFPNDVRIWCSYPKHEDGSGGMYYGLLLNANAARPDISPPLWSMGDELVDGPVLNAAQQSSDSKWVVCGQFKNVKNGGVWVPRNRVARFNSALNTLDTSYDVGVGPNGVVNQISPMSPGDDRMLMIGNFNTWNGAACGYLMRLTTSGGVDGSFTPGTGADDRIRRLNWNSDGSGGWVSGYFRSYNGQPRGGIAGLNADGSCNGSFANVTAMAGFSGTIYSLATQKDGKILIGGDFSGVGGKYRGGMARINPDGSLDPSFKGGVDGAVKSVAVQSDGKILVAGNFGTCQSYSRTSLARMNPDGSLDTAFKPLLVSKSNYVNDLRQVLPLSTGKLMIAGWLADSSGWNYYPVARLNSDGSKDSSFDASGFTIPGVDPSSLYLGGSRVAVAGSKYLITGGWANDTASTRGGFLARLNDDGTTDPTFGPSTHVQTMDGEVEDMFIQGDGWIFASGNFTHVTGESGSPARSAIARFSADGHLDATFMPGLTPPVGANTIIIPAMAGQPNGKVLILEHFFNHSGYWDYYYLSSQVARLNPNGALDSTFNLGNLQYGWANGPTQGNGSIVRFPDGKALIGGNFSSYNGTGAWSLVRVFASPANFNPGILLLLGN